MDHQLGRIALINWQGRRNRRVKTGGGFWAWILATSALAGAILLAAQAAGLLRWTGVAAGVPGALLVVGLSLQITAVLRAILAWLAG